MNKIMNKIHVRTELRPLPQEQAVLDLVGPDHSIEWPELDQSIVLDARGRGDKCWVSHTWGTLSNSWVVTFRHDPQKCTPDRHPWCHDRGALAELLRRPARERWGDKSLPLEYRWATWVAWNAAEWTLGDTTYNRWIGPPPEGAEWTHPKEEYTERPLLEAVLWTDHGQLVVPVGLWRYDQAWGIKLLRASTEQIWAHWGLMGRRKRRIAAANHYGLLGAEMRRRRGEFV